MKNLMRQKIVFGVLMACVLALGVQGTADAMQTECSYALQVAERADLSTKNIAFHHLP